MESVSAIINFYTDLSLSFLLLFVCLAYFNDLLSGHVSRFEPSWSSASKRIRLNSCRIHGVVSYHEFHTNFYLIANQELVHLETESVQSPYPKIGSVELGSESEFFWEPSHQFVFVFNKQTIVFRKHTK